MEAVTLSAEALACPICMEWLKDPFVTPCGHSFCFTCLTTHLQNKSVCPCCSSYITSNAIFPNYLLSKVVEKAAKAESQKKGSLVEQLQEAIASDEHKLGLPDLNLLLETLEEKRHDMQQREKENSLELLLHFLNHSRESKTRKLEELQEELQILNKDIHQVEARQAGLPSAAPPFIPLQGGQGGGFNLAPAIGGTVPAWRHLHSAGGSSQPSSSGREEEHAHSMAEPGEAGASRAQAFQMPQQLSTRAAVPGRMPSSSGLFRSDGRHLSSSALGLDLLADPHLFGRNATRESEVQPVGSAIQLSSDPAGTTTTSERAPTTSEDMSLPPRMGAAPRASSSLPPSTSSERQPSSSIGPQSETPPSASGHERDGGAVSLTQQRLPGSMPMALLSHPEGMSVSQRASVPAASNALRRLSSEPSSAFARQAALDARGGPGAGAAVDPHSRARKRRFESQFEDLQQHYLRMRQRQLDGVKRSRSLEPARPLLESPVSTDTGARAAVSDALTHPAIPAASRAALGTGPDDLQEFSRMLAMFTNTSKLKVLAAIPGSSQRTSAAIISSIAFDREARLFGTAGVSKRISIFNFHEVVDSAADQSNRQAAATPALELVSRSKLSCLSWNCVLGPQLISSDYEGVVTLWDAHAGHPLTEYEAHDKRIWSIDFCPSDPKCLVSGSDDGFVKVWSTGQPERVAEIDVKANVCCVKYAPENAHELAVGSADHNVHLYDLRNTSKPVFVFPGHRKAVSYVRYLNGRELVSASTDSTLRLWNTLDLEPVRTYSGHVNEKNFVGLSLGGDFIACGSETSEVFVYYRSMSKPIARRVFSSPSPSTSGSSGPQQNMQFISAVSWRPDSQTLLAADSQGAVKAMQLTS